MSRNHFREGGPFDARSEGPDRMTWKVPIPQDDQGRVARCCPQDACSPGYFTVTFGTGITEEQCVIYCPYCRHESDPSDFLTEEQARYLQDVVLHEATHAIQDMFKSAFRGGSDAIRYEPGRIRQPRSPFEDTVQRNVVCPHCGLDHAVFGLAIWCPDCARDIFMSHVEAEYGVVRAMLGDVERRRKELGARIGARDLENCLEDIVSIFEAVLKAMLIRHLYAEGKSGQEIEELFNKRFGNRLQNPERAAEIVRNRMNQELFEGMSDGDVRLLKNTFEKRHPITHNLGVMDKKYLERAMAAEKEGKDILVTKAEIEKAIGLSLGLFGSLHKRVFGESNKSSNEEATRNKENDHGER